MKQFKIFKNPLNQIEAVKQGWSWPAFGFTWIWALIKKLWPLGFGLLVATIVYNLFYYNIDRADSRVVISIIATIIFIIIGIIMGINGNSWREKNLLLRGYEYQDVVTAANPEGAKALFIKNNI